MRSYKLKLATALLLSMITTTLHAENNKARIEQVEQLFKLTQMEKQIQQSVENILQLQLRQNPNLISQKETVGQFFIKHIGWHALKNDIAEMYMNTFSEKELATINAFYISPAGQKVINVVPQLVQQRNQLAMGRLQENIGELQKILAESAPKK